MNWIKTMVNMGDDPRLHRLADALRVPVAQAVGSYVLVILQFPAHAKTGDVSAVPDRTLEEWARWKGKRGTFASAFRAICCDDAGVVVAWDRINGATIRNAEQSAERARSWREANANRTHTNLVRTPEKRREEKRELQDQLPPRAARREKSPAWPLCPVETSTAMCDRWRAKIGAAHYGRFRAAVAPAFSADRQLSPGEAAEVVSYYAWKKDRNYQRIADFASSLWSWVDAYRAAQREDGAA